MEFCFIKHHNWTIINVKDTGNLKDILRGFKKSLSFMVKMLRIFTTMLVLWK